MERSTAKEKSEQEMRRKKEGKQEIEKMKNVV